MMPDRYGIITLAGVANIIDAMQANSVPRHRVKFLSRAVFRLAARQSREVRIQSRGLGLRLVAEHSAY
jgi:hypothetical protein